MTPTDIQNHLLEQPYHGTSIWLTAYYLIHPRNYGPRKEYWRLVNSAAWFDAGMSLLPTDRAVRFHRYRGKRSGWCCVSRAMELPELEVTSPVPSNAQLGMEFFTMCPLLENAILLVALKCAGIIKQPCPERLSS